MIYFFSDFGNQRELENIVYFWEFFKHGAAKQIKKQRVAGSYVEEIIAKHSNDRNKDGSLSANYKLEDTDVIMRECEDRVQELHLSDLGVLTKIKSFNEAMGYNGYVSGRDEDRAILFVRDIFPVKRKRDGKQFGYNVLTQSIGSGIESKFTIFNRVYENEPVKKGDVIKCLGYERDSKGYLTMTRYRHILLDDDPMADLEE